jgi:small subunit ribosomal protein S17
MVENIGIDTKPPEKKCDDVNCPYHRHLRVRGKILEGRVVSDKMERSVIVERERMYSLKKYERFEKRISRTPAHNPPCINAKVGDRVRIAECRPLSKTVAFVVVEVLP